MAFRLPPEISSQKVQLPQGWAYLFRHKALGQIGRIVLLPHPDGRTIASAEVTGEPDDPMTEKRRGIFEPIANQLMEAFDQAMMARGRPATETINQSPTPIPRQTTQVATKIFNCITCGANVGLIIFAEPGLNDGILEDAARAMHKKVKEFDVPTWIIGEISGLGNPMKNKARIMKVHPQREPVFEASPQMFNLRLEALEKQHCQ